MVLVIGCVGLALAEAPKTPAGKLKLTPPAEFAHMGLVGGALPAHGTLTATDASKHTTTVTVPVHDYSITAPATGPHTMTLAIEGAKLDALKGEISTVKLVFHPVGTGTEVSYQVDAPKNVTVTAKDANDKSVQLTFAEIVQTWVDGGKTVNDQWVAQK